MGPLACIVCRRERIGDRGKKTKVVILPSGTPARLCEQCEGDRFRVAEAERRVKAQ